MIECLYCLNVEKNCVKDTENCIRRKFAEKFPLYHIYTFSVVKLKKKIKQVHLSVFETEPVTFLQNRTECNNLCGLVKLFYLVNLYLYVSYILKPENECRNVWKREIKANKRRTKKMIKENLSTR